jgi:hypothetical protein
MVLSQYHSRSLGSTRVLEPFSKMIMKVSGRSVVTRTLHRKDRLRVRGTLESDEDDKEFPSVMIVVAFLAYLCRRKVVAPGPPFGILQVALGTYLRLQSHCDAAHAVGVTPCRCPHRQDDPFRKEELFLDAMCIQI